MSKLINILKIRVNDEDRARFMQAATERDMSLSSMIREAIEHYLKTKTK